MLNIFNILIGFGILVKFYPINELNLIEFENTQAENLI
jgi:hypothetical protein